ncbi:sulfite exporter TauE/SafE family protein [Tateyamaria sp.]|uniref:sulfite exporter TauE/SafE family protein n=1 Tax=Tateyamaria sp. TaxID=1929288 RepID=UPI0039B8F516
MITEFYIYLALGALAGGFINGLSGTGTALFALGFYLVVLDPIQAVAVVAFMSVLVGLQGLWVVRAEIKSQPTRLLRFLIPGLVGIPIGLALLERINEGTLRITVAALLILYGCYFGFRATLPAFSRRTPVIDSVVGLIGGILGGAAAVSGAIPAMWVSIRPWTKAETRAVLQPFNVVVLGTTICLLFWKGAYDATALLALAITIPIGLIAAQIGITVFKRLTDNAFRRLLILLTLMMGVGIMISEVF